MTSMLKCEDCPNELELKKTDMLALISALTIARHTQVRIRGQVSDDIRAAIDRDIDRYQKLEELIEIAFDLDE